MKKVAGSRGVRYPNPIGGSIPEARAIPRERAVHAERGADGARTVFAPKLRQCFEEILLSGGIGGEFFGGDGVVHEGKEMQKSWSQVIEVRYNWDAGGAGPRCGDTGGCRVVAVDVEEAGRGDPASLEKCGR